ncbi:RND transporter [Rhodoferax lacus]|uniref:RND transporter n=1 Tax=Rhodoferax lacus TaxID=2184758 RepID=A0A3E1REG2_9BURK|nr:RND transporter [Rhodoferax lacus]
MFLPAKPTPVRRRSVVASPVGRHALSLGLLCALLTGCASTAPGSSTPPFIDVPARWQNTTLERSSDLSSWWLRFDDPQLSALVADALRANPTIASARAAVRQARALRDVSNASLYPTLSTTLSAQNNRVNNSNDNTGTGTNTNTNTNTSTDRFALGLDAGWEIDVFGANRSGVNAAEAAATASATSLGDVQVSIAAELALDYIALRNAQERLEIARSNLAIQLDTLQIVEWRLQAGLVTTLETEQSRTALEQTRSLIPALQVSIDQGAHAIAILTGRTPEALLGQLAPVASVPQPADDITLSFPAETLRQRADVRFAEYQITAAAARESQAEAARLPSFRLGGSIGLNALTLVGLGSGATVVSGLLASVSLPLFEGGALSAQVRAQHAALEQAQSAYKTSVLGALRDVEDALVALRGDRLRLASLRLAAASAANASELAGQRFQSGLVDFQTVLDTQRTRLSTQDSVASAYAAVSADHVRLYKALGGGWQSDLRNSEL